MLISVRNVNNIYMNRNYVLEILEKQSLYEITEGKV